MLFCKYLKMAKADSKNFFNKGSKLSKCARTLQILLMMLRLNSMKDLRDHKIVEHLSNSILEMTLVILQKTTMYAVRISGISHFLYILYH